MQYLVRGNFFSGFGALAASIGADASHLFEAFGLPRDLESRPEQFVSFRQAVALIEHCSDSLGCHDVGIRLAQHQGISMLGPVAVLVRNTRTIADAFEAMSRYMHVVAPALRISFDRSDTGGYVRLHIAVLEERLPSTRQVLETLLGNGTQIARMLTNDTVSALRMHFSHARLAPAEIYRRAYGCEVLFDQDICAVDIPISVMRRRVIGADNETARIASEYLQAHHFEWNSTLEQQVRDLVRALLPTGQCNIRTIAAAITLQPRTLQRRLAQESASAGDIIDDERRKLAAEHLARPEMRLSQIVGLLGYSNQSAFNRSCQRWFGRAPGVIRADTRASI